MYKIGHVYQRGADLIYITEQKHISSIGVAEHFVWRVINSKTGRLGELGTGYGGLSDNPVDCTITVTIKLNEITLTE